MARTYQQQLDDLDTLIQAIELQQIAGYSSPGLSVSLPSLDILYKRREILEKRALQEANGNKIKVRRGVLKH